MSEINGRDVAVAQLNEFYEARGVFEEDRIIAEFDAEEIKAFEYMSDEEVAEAKELGDPLREVIIRALQRQEIVLNEEHQFEYKLSDPPMKDGSPLIATIKFKKRYTGAAFLSNTVGVKRDDLMLLNYASIASRCGISTSLFKLLSIDDIEVCQAVAGIYSRK